MLLPRGPLRERCRGRWKEILPYFGLNKHHLSGQHGPCPMCGGKDRFRFVDYEGSGGYICSGCGNGDGFDLVMRRGSLSFADAAAAIEKIVNDQLPAPPKEKYGRRPALRDQTKAISWIWDSATPVQKGDRVYNYLLSRGIVLPQSVIEKDVLRYTPRCRYADKDTHFPAMLAKVAENQTATHCQVHRTYLSHTKDALAPVQHKRKLMAGKGFRGSSVPLFRIRRDGILGVAEGIENALSAAALFDIPVWAALSAHMLHDWLLPRYATRIVVFADNDVNFTGQSAAYALANKLYLRDKIPIEVIIPDYPGWDWNDVLMHKKGMLTKPVPEGERDIKMREIPSVASWTEAEAQSQGA